MKQDNHDTTDKNMITVLIVEPGKEPFVKEIDSSLESLQHEVGGYIEAVYPFKEPVALITNEEGKLCGLPLNRALCDDDGKIYDVIAGTFIVSGLTEDNFGSLDKAYIKQFSEHFHDPERFVKVGNQIFVTRIAQNQEKQDHVKQKEHNEPER